MNIYRIDERERPFTLAEFWDVNPELDPAEIAIVAALKFGESYTGGGGASATWTITRVGPDPRIDLPFGTMVEWRGRLGRVLRRELNPCRKPGIGRVFYTFEAAWRRADGSIKFGVYQHQHVAAKVLRVRDDLPAMVRIGS